MTFSLGWDRRDETGRRVNLEFSLVRDKATWLIRRERGEPRESYAPTREDWDELLEVMERHLARGKVTHEDFRIVTDLRDKAT